MTARYELHGNVAVITLDNPPVNGLGHATRSGVASGIERANADPSVDVIVLIGAGKVFSGGADIREFNTPKATAEPRLVTVIRADRSKREAGRRRDPRRLHGRRPRACARVPLPDRRPDALDRAARGQARLAARCGRHAAVAARRRRRARDADDRERRERAGQRLCAIPASSTRSWTAICWKVRWRSPETSSPSAGPSCACAISPSIARTRGSLSRRERRRRSTRKVSPRRNGVSTRWRQRRRCRSMKASPSSATRSRISSPRPSRGRCAMRFSPSARRRAFPASPTTTPTRKIASIGVIGAGTMGTGIAMNGLSAGTSGRAAGDEPGGARSRRRDDPTQLPGVGRARKADAGRAREAACRCCGPHSPTTTLPPSISSSKRCSRRWI